METPKSQALFSARFLMRGACSLLAICWGFVSPSPAFSESTSSTTTEVEDDCAPVGIDKASAALNAAQAWAKGLTTFQAQFTQESSAVALGASEQSGGEVFFQNPGRMRWRYEWPNKQDFVIEGDTMRLYQPDLNQMLIDSAQKILTSDLPVAFLSGIASVTDKFSLVRGCKADGGIADGKDPRDSRVRLELKPKQGGAVRRLDLVVEPVKSRVVAASVIDESENITSFSFARIVEGRPLAKNQFELTVPAGTDVQDNRRNK